MGGCRGCRVRDVLVACRKVVPLSYVHSNAQALIDDFWDKKKKNKKSKPRVSKPRSRKSDTKDASPVAEESASKNKRKKSTGNERKSKSTQPEDADMDEEDEEDEEDKPRTKKAKKTPRAKEKNEDQMDVDERMEEVEYLPMKKHRNQKSWESLVKRVDTIEKIDGSLKVFFTL